MQANKIFQVVSFTRLTLDFKVFFFYDITYQQKSTIKPVFGRSWFDSCRGLIFSLFNARVILISSLSQNCNVNQNKSSFSFFSYFLLYQISTTHIAPTDALTVISRRQTRTSTPNVFSSNQKKARNAYLHHKQARERSVSETATNYSQHNKTIYFSLTLLKSLKQFRAIYIYIYVI